jgi:peptidoglycan/LPS O-acetylase OafA/YrhL
MRREIVALTSLRGLAAVSVVAMHFSATMQDNASGNFPSLAPHGELAVDVFFVLSGFILGYTYLDSFRQKEGLSAYRNFLVKRAARILPLNIAIVLFLEGSALITTALFGSSAFRHVRTDHALLDSSTNILMLPGLGIGNSINWPSWSISVEFLAYFLFPVFLIGIFESGRFVFIVSCTLAVLLLLVVCATGVHLSPDGFNNQPLPWRDISRCISEFVLGLATYRVYRSERLNSYFGHDLAAILLGSCIGGLILLKESEILMLPFFPALVLALSLNKGRISKILASRVPYFLGTISFSLYLVHDNLRAVIATLVRHFHPALLSPPAAMAVAAISTGLMIVPAWFCYHLIEKPGRYFLRSGPSIESSKASPSCKILGSDQRGEGLRD